MNTAPVAQWIERQPSKLDVGGSNPPERANRSESHGPSPLAVAAVDLGSPQAAGAGCDLDDNR